MKRRDWAFGLLAACALFGSASFFYAAKPERSTQNDSEPTTRNTIATRTLVTVTTRAVTKDSALPQQNAASAPSTSPVAASRVGNGHDDIDREPAFDPNSLLNEKTANLELFAALEQKLGKVPAEVHELVRLESSGASNEELETWARTHLPPQLLMRALVGRWLHSIRGEATPHMEAKLGPSQSPGKIGRLVAR
jgi:hypothetical protein